MAGAPANNIRIAHNPIKISLPDSKRITSTHTCDIVIPGLPQTLVGHIMPEMKMASLLGILCKAGCEVIFDNEKCRVTFNGKTIMTGSKDPTSDLWMLPIMSQAEQWTTPASKTTPSRPGPCEGRAPLSPVTATDIATFSYHRTTKANAVMFMHQSLGNPPKSSLIMAINAGFLRRAPHLDIKSVTKYLMPSPATSKGHMKRPRKGLHSTTPKPTGRHKPPSALPRPPSIPGIHADDMPGLIPIDDDDFSDPGPAFIADIDDESITHVFCFGAFADKNTGVVYSDCTGNFPFMSLDGNVCFFVMYHYETNTIFATPILGLDSQSILNAYKKNFEFLVSKGYHPKLNIMDNQATKAIKSYLTPQQCQLQLIEPGNHRVNVAERAIQTFKNRFIGALGTTDVDFPIQLWDKLAPQVQDSINLLRRSRIDLTKSAYEVLEGPYD